MNTIELIILAVKYHWDAHRSNPANLIAGALGMIINNLIVLWGLWAMLFHGKPNAEKLTIYFLALNALVTISWGFVHLIFGGIRSLAEYIDDGSLESMLGTARSPLLLISISQSSIPAIGDITQGFLNLIVILILGDPEIAMRCLAFTILSTLAFYALFIFAGSLVFFIKRAGTLSQLIIECTLSLSFYPTGKVFTDNARLMLFLTPAVATAVLPIEAIESGSLSLAAIAILVVMLFLLFAVKFFYLGLKRYQSSSYVMARK